MVLVVTLRCLLNDDAATLYMTISDKEENENEGLRFDELCFLTSYDTANKPYEAEAEAGQRTIENQINLELVNNFYFNQNKYNYQDQEVLDWSYSGF